ncbi:hypothetical protein TNCT_159541 [Trichonephila clavata]|uniref:Uncharacterized protein n=1 Tax=Trichonephila clavata TaxID=2740835 RepID=A0A8X6F184_TRICU|nr:hypothetical protein TNCT_159541 [Trichonephila clavata]
MAKPGKPTWDSLNTKAEITDLVPLGNGQRALCIVATFHQAKKKIFLLFLLFFALPLVLSAKHLVEVLINNGQRARFQLLDINIASSAPLGLEAIT